MDKAYKRAARRDWLIGALITSAMLAAIILWGDLRYAGNDDGVMLRPLMGFGGDTPPDFYQCLHPIIAYPLIWLSSLVPATPWFSYMQLLMLWLAGAVSVKCIAGGFGRRGISAAWGALAGAVYLAVFWATYSCHVTFTVTAAALGAAAVLQTLSLDARRQTDGQALRALLLALLLVILAYGLRQVVALPILAFCALALCYRFFADFIKGGKPVRPLKPIVCFLIIGAVTFGALIGGRELEIRLKGKQEYLRWQQASTKVIDYYKLDELPDELLAEIGWTRAEQKLVNRWYFMDSNINADAFERIAEYMGERDARTLGERLNTALKSVAALKDAEPTAWRSALALAGVMLMCALCLCLWRKGAMWRWLLIISGAALALALLVYLGLSGRLPLRAAMPALLPFAALACGLLPDCLPDAETRGKSIAKRVAAYAAAVCVLALSVGYAVPAAQELKKTDASGEESNPFADLDEYASEYPEYLIIYDDTFASDTRMFPTVEFGTPDNVMFWGGWPARSQVYNDKLKAYGIDPATCDVTLFLNEDVRLARGVVDSEPTELYEYMSERAGGEVYIMMDTDWGGVHTLEFYIDE